MAKIRLCGRCAFTFDCIEHLKEGGKITYNNTKRECIGTKEGNETMYGIKGFEFFVPHLK